MLDVGCWMMHVESRISDVRRWMLDVGMLDIGMIELDVGCCHVYSRPTSNIQHMQHPTSNVQHASIRHPTSYIQHPTSNTVSNIQHPTAYIQHPILYPTSNIHSPHASNYHHHHHHIITMLRASLDCFDVGCCPTKTGGHVLLTVRSS